MLDLFPIAFRNVSRNRRRSLITIITVFIGVTVVIGTRGLLNGLQGEIRSGLTRKMHGDLQVHKASYHDTIDADPYKVLMEFSSDHESQLKELAEIKAWSPRLRIMALLNHQKSQVTTPVIITGINAEAELDVCPRLLESIVHGKIIDPKLENFATNLADDDLDAAVGLDENQKTAKDQPTENSYHQIMVTPSMMRGLGAQLGDEIMILMQDRHNMQQAILTRLVGVVDYGLPTAGSRMAWMDLNTLTKITRSTGKVTEVAIRTHDTSLASDRTLSHTVGNVFGASYLVETWQELAGFLRDAMVLQNAIFTAVVLVVFLIVIAAIINTSLMTVMERTREIGTLTALGYRRIHILSLFLIEAASIGALGGIAGVAVAAIGTKILNHVGINFTLPGEKLHTVLYPDISWWFLTGTLAVAICAALIAALAPAYRASKMRPVVALATS